MSEASPYTTERVPVEEVDPGGVLCIILTIL